MGGERLDRSANSGSFSRENLPGFRKIMKASFSDFKCSTDDQKKKIY